MAIILKIIEWNDTYFLSRKVYVLGYNFFCLVSGKLHYIVDYFQSAIAIKKFAFGHPSESM